MADSREKIEQIYRTQPQTARDYMAFGSRETVTPAAPSEPLETITEITTKEPVQAQTQEPPAAQFAQPETPVAVETIAALQQVASKLADIRAGAPVEDSEFDWDVEPRRELAGELSDTIKELLEHTEGLTLGALNQKVGELFGRREEVEIVWDGNETDVADHENLSILDIAAGVGLPGPVLEAIKAFRASAGLDDNALASHVGDVEKRFTQQLAHSTAMSMLGYTPDQVISFDGFTFEREAAEKVLGNHAATLEETLANFDSADLNINDRIYEADYEFYMFGYTEDLHYNLQENEIQFIQENGGNIYETFPGSGEYYTTTQELITASDNYNLENRNELNARIEQTKQDMEKVEEGIAPSAEGQQVIEQKAEPILVDAAQNPEMTASPREFRTHVSPSASGGMDADVSVSSSFNAATQSPVKVADAGQNLDKSLNSPSLVTPSV